LFQYKRTCDSKVLHKQITHNLHP